MTSENTLSIVDDLIERYSPEPVPPCNVCGGPLSIQQAGGGAATIWGCSPFERDPDDPELLRRKADRLLVDDHYSRSRWTQYRSGDERVVAAAAVIKELVEALTNCRAVLWAIEDVAVETGFAKLGDIIADQVTAANAVLERVQS